MKSLKRNKAVKILCFLLACFFLGLFTLNAAAGILAVAADRMDLYFNAFSDTFTEEVYEALAQRIAHALRNKDVVYYAAEGQTEEFFYRYRSLAEGNTNFAFTVSDDTGKVLLSNFTPKGTLARYDTQIAVALYENGGQIYYEYDADLAPTGVYYENEITETTTEETEPEAPSAETTLPQTAETDVSGTSPTGETEASPAAQPAETETEPTHASEPTVTEPPQETDAETTENTGRVNTDPVDRGNEDVYIRDDTEEGYKSVMMYIYPLDDGINDAILEHCIELYHKSFEPREAQYYQSGTYEVYHQSDFAVSANGTAYFIGTARPETTTAIEAPAPIAVKYYTLTVYVDDSLAANDIARLVSRVMGFAQWYLKHYAAITVITGVAALVLCIFSLCLAGYVKGEDQAAARGIHKLPTDLLILVFAGILIPFGIVFVDGIGYFGKMSGPDDWVIPLATLPCIAIILFTFVYMFTVKVKSHTAVSSILLLRFCKWLFALVREAVKAMRFEWKLGIIFGAVFVLGGIAGLLTVLYVSNGFLALLWIVWKLAEAAFLLLLAVNLHTLHTGAKDLSEGRHVRVENRFLFGEFKKHADYLNGIGDGINAAVEERMKSETTKTELITNISHDLKTPLTSIVNYIDLLKKEPAQTEKAQEYIAAIDRASQRLKKLTSDIVDASKAAAGSMQMTPEDTDLTVLLGQVKGEYEERLSARGLTLVESIPETPLTVYADGRLLWRVFDNLMSNVAKYSMPNTRVYLTVTEENGKANIEFKNISESPLNIDPAALTDRFVRGDASRNSEGSGLGLNIAQSLAQNMGGTLSIGIDGDLFKATLTFPLKKN